MDLKQLEYITVIAEEHSISKAARRLFLSPSALSQYLRRLEETEHLPPLFYRRGRELLLTDAGRIYVNGALAILSLSKKLEDSAPQKLSSLHIALPSYLEELFLTECLPVFSGHFPHILTDIRTEETDAARKRLLEGQLQAAVLPEESQGLPSSLVSRPLGHDRIVLAASSNVSPSLKEAGTFSFIMPSSGTIWHKMCRDICLEENLQPSVFCRTGNFQASAALLQRRSPLSAPLAAFLPETVFRRQAEKENGLREIPLNRSYTFRISFTVLSGESIFREPLDKLYEILSDRLGK